MSDRILLPALDAAADGLRSVGAYQAVFGVPEVKPLIEIVIDRMLAEYAHVKAELVALEVRLEHSKGVAAGALKVLSPVTALISPLIVLANDPDPTRIVLSDLQMKTEAGFLAKGMIAAFNLEGKLRQMLVDPNKALSDVLIPELRGRGAALTALSLHFNETALVAHLAGHAA